MVDPLCAMSNSAFQLAPARASWLTRRLAKPGGVPTSEGVSRSVLTSAGLERHFPNPLSRSEQPPHEDGGQDGRGRGRRPPYEKGLHGVVFDTALIG